MPPSMIKPSTQEVIRIATEEAEKAGLDPNLIMGCSRRKGLREARGRIWSRIVKETGCTVGGLAVTWGGDRSTVHYAIRAVRRLEERSA